MRILSGLILLTGMVALAQPGCPPVSFQTAIPMNAKPSPSSHLVFVRQAGGSYTAYEMADAPPYQTLRTTPNLGATLHACLPAQTVLPPLPAPPASGVTPGMSSQAVVFERFASGGFLQVQALSSGAVDLAVFSADMTLLSDTQDPVQAGPFSLADVTGDGKLDLIAAEYRGKQEQGILVFPGNGNGTFQSPIETLVPGTDLNVRPSSFAVADVDGDGKPDLVLTLLNPSHLDELALMKGNGDGTFGNPSQVLAGYALGGVALADLNGDGRVDIVAGVTGAPLLSGPTSVLVALAEGGGVFGAPATYGVADAASPLIADANGDGVPDIVAGGSILFGDGSGAFPERADYVAEQNNVLADIDGDGRLDLVTAATGNPWIFSGVWDTGVLPGVGGGGFRGAIVTPVPSLPARSASILATATADFDGDGIPDLVLSDTAAGITILKGSKSGVFTPVFDYRQTADQAGLPGAIATADFDHDGKIDLAVALFAYAPLTANRVLIFLGNGDGTLRKPKVVTLPTGLSVAALAAADFDRDGKTDLAVVVNSLNDGTTDEVLVYPGNGNGTFQAAKVHALGTGACAIVVGDFNRDGMLDIATADAGPFSTSNAAISILPGKGDGTFGKTVSVDLPATMSPAPDVIATADLDGDGTTDFVVSTLERGTQNRQLAVVQGNGDGTFHTPSIWPVTGDGAAAADLNGDGIPDLIESSGYRLGYGDGTFAPQSVLTSGRPFVVGDFDRDGKLDLVYDGFEGVALYLNTSPALPPVRGRYHWVAP